MAGLKTTGSNQKLGRQNPGDQTADAGRRGRRIYCDGGPLRLRKINPAAHGGGPGTGQQRRYLIDRKRVTEMEPKDRGIAMVFQNYALYPHMSVEENMAWGLKIRGLGRGAYC